MQTIVTEVQGSPVTVEVGRAGGELERVGAGSSAAKQAEEAFTAALDTIVRVSRAFSTAMETLGPDQPESFELSFGIKFAATGDVWLAKATAEAQLVAKVSWRR